jgi:hypothetical protein
MAWNSDNMSENDWGSVAKGTSKVAAGLGNIIGSEGRITDQNALATAATEGIDDFYKRYTRGEFDSQMSPEMLKYFGLQFQKTDNTDLLASQATTQDLITDPRTMSANLTGLNNSNAQGIQKSKDSDAMRSAGILKDQGMAYQNLMDTDLAFGKQVFGDKLKQDQMAYGQTQQNIAEINKLRSEGYANLAVGAGEIFGSLATGFGKNGMKIPKFHNGGKGPGHPHEKPKYKYLDFAYLGTQGQTSETDSINYEKGFQFGLNTPSDQISLYQASNVFDAGVREGRESKKKKKYQDGGDVMQQILAAQGQGGDGIPPRQDLPGEESHEANPISMVAPDGEVVGEATGGEIILNGEQTEDIENAVAAVDQAIESGQEPSMEALMALYEAVSKTLSQPQFQDGEQKGPPVDPAQERMLAMLDGGQQAA